MAKANQIIEVEVDKSNASLLIFHVKGEGTLQFDMSRVHPDLKHRAEQHGWVQRISDAAAIAKDRATGASATPAMKYEAMGRLVDHYMTGTSEWSRAGDGQGAKSLVIEAVAKMRGLTYVEAEEQIQAFADKFHGKDKRAALERMKRLADVQEVMAEIQRSRMPAPVLDADAELNAFMQGGLTEETTEDAPEEPETETESEAPDTARKPARRGKRG